MAFYIAILLIVLACLVFALRGVFGDFPARWEWVGMVLAGVGILMGSPTIFQMIWGRPGLSAEFENDAQGEARSLVVFLKNPPVRGLAKMLGVRRDAVQSLTASLRISEVGSGKIIIPVRQAMIYSDNDETDNGRQRTTLPPTYSVGASIMVAMWDIHDQRVIVPPSRTHPETALSEGYYEAAILFFVDGEHQEMTRRFTVGQGADDLKWCPESTAGRQRGQRLPAS
jgi:hypothetical protein